MVIHVSLCLYLFVCLCVCVSTGGAMCFEMALMKAISTKRKYS